eukprot:TRINITY_DN653_c0_g1_i3.p2 TRINITY_DN653_c0_g1~~TRINITY_DN653_c0_g1_i3.p2  ORF type:complete len:133 (-),score=59.28 TRINITY_DN653_c0_g1_i3:467-865(-)
MLVYIPTDRVKPLEACAHSFFDPLRSNSGPTSSSSSSTNPTLSTSPPSTSHTSYKQPEKIFHFTQEEVSYATKNGFIEKLLPLGQTTPTKFDANTAIYDTAKSSDAGVGGGGGGVLESKNSSSDEDDEDDDD